MKVRVVVSNEKKKLPPSRTADQFLVRFPDGMRPRIEEEARTNERSMNSEIIARLSVTLTAQTEAPRLADSDVERIAARVVQLLKFQ